MGTKTNRSQLRQYFQDFIVGEFIFSIATIQQEAVKEQLMFCMGGAIGKSIDKIGWNFLLGDLQEQR